jgi:DNA-binding HxlR family transcriptional regulator
VASRALKNAPREIRTSRRAAEPAARRPGATPRTSGAPRKGRPAQRAIELRPTDIERLIHERTRLGIASALAVNETLSFNELKALLKTTDGNLSVHARKLEEADYIACRKYFDGRVPKTEYRLTSTGRRALERYLDQMESLIRATRKR